MKTTEVTFAEESVKADEIIENLEFFGLNEEQRRLELPQTSGEPPEETEIKNVTQVTLARYKNLDTPHIESIITKCPNLSTIIFKDCTCGVDVESIEAFGLFNTRNITVKATFSPNNTISDPTSADANRNISVNR